jgi:hypothetical protein
MSSLTKLTCVAVLAAVSFFSLSSTAFAQPHRVYHHRHYHHHHHYHRHH